MNRLRARAGSALLACVLAAALCPAARADDASSLWFGGTHLILAHAESNGGDLAVGVHDTGLVAFLARLGATISWSPGQRYVVITAGDRRTISLTVGDPRIGTANGTVTAPFAPYVEASEAYVPFFALARALYVEPVRQPDEIVMQPQVGALDVRQDGRKTIVVVHGATPLRFTKISESADHLTLAFGGVASSLAQTRQIGSAALADVGLTVTGNVKNPTSTITFDGAKGSAHALYSSTTANEVTIAFAPAGVALGGLPVPDSAAAGSLSLVPAPPGAMQGAPAAAAIAAAPAPAQQAYAPANPAYSNANPNAPPPPPAGGYAAPAAAAQPASVTSVDVLPVDNGSELRVALSGPVNYEWHRLADNRYYVDLKGATLAVAPLDQAGNTPVQSLRVRQIGDAQSPVVRIALTLAGDRQVQLSVSGTTLFIAAWNMPDSDVARSGIGAVGSPPAGAAVAQATYPNASAPTASDNGSGSPVVAPPGWKFGSAAPSIATAPPPAPGSNPRLIVIDPGHGGSDTGAEHNGLVEKDLTLDISQRLRSVLIAQGWQVKMTRTTDVDVVAPDDDAKTELQGRCDVANNAGARLFVSVHINSFTTSDLNGTTTYYYKPGDVSFAEAIHHHLAAVLPTKDDGVRRENFYVVHHTTMPAVLVETAFLSNPTDAGYLRSPSFLQSVAQGIADGIKEYAGSPRSLTDAGVDH